MSLAECGTPKAYSGTSNSFINPSQDFAQKSQTTAADMRTHAVSVLGWLSGCQQQIASFAYGMPDAHHLRNFPTVVTFSATWE
jgi:hypothetical protein